MAKKLELTWVGKEEPINVEPRLLIENTELSYKADNDEGITDNILIHGDNLLALKALEQDYTGKIKCIYIDPPYNTGEAFEHYDDNLEHSIWLGLMKSRLEILKNLLAEDGCIFVQIDDNEQAYLKVLMDEIFGRNNFVNIITVKTKIGGVSGSSEGKSLKDATEFINVFAKNKLKLEINNVYNYTEIGKYIKQYKEDGKSWKYTSIITKLDGKKLIFEDEIYKYYSYDIFESMSVTQFAKKHDISESEVYNKYAGKIFRTTNAQSSIRQRVMNKKYLLKSDIVSIEYAPIKGKNMGKITEVLYKGEKCNMFMFLSDMLENIDKKNYYKEKLTTLWEGIQYNNLAKEGDNSFPNGKKPELLLNNIIELSTNPNDIVLDSFLGSGTTAAVAHKMGRRFIGIEMGAHAYSHCKVRLDKVIDGEDKAGITKSVNWQGGGGYKFYELAPSLINKDVLGEAVINSEYSADMLASAVALHEGFKFNPDKKLFWKQSVSNENSYLFVTTRHLNSAYLESIKTTMEQNEFLIIACRSFDEKLEKAYKNIKIKKIPQMLLDKCEFGEDNYNLNIINPPIYEDEEEIYDE